MSQPRGRPSDLPRPRRCGRVGEIGGGEVDHRRATDGQHHSQNQPTLFNDDTPWNPCELRVFNGNQRCSISLGGHSQGGSAGSNPVGATPHNRRSAPRTSSGQVDNARICLVRGGSAGSDPTGRHRKTAGHNAWAARLPQLRRDLDHILTTPRSPPTSRPETTRREPSLRADRRTPSTLPAPLLHCGPSDP